MRHHPTRRRTFVRGPRNARAGFSLVELLVAVVLLGIVGGALTRLVVDQMRFFDNVQVARGARSAARNSMNVLFSELRMVQSEGGVTDVSATNKSITLIVPYRFGTLCGTAAGTSTVSLLPIDSVSRAMASFGGYGYRAPATLLYVNTETTAPPTVVGTTDAVCTAAFINTLTIKGRAGEIVRISPSTIPTTVAAGTPVMLFQKITYSFQASSLYPGKVGLYRAVNGGTAEELVAPFAGSARFYYYQTGDDTPRSAAPAPADIRGIAFALTAEGARKPAGRTTETESRMMTGIFFKNVR